MPHFDMFVSGRESCHIVICLLVRENHIPYCDMFVSVRESCHIVKCL